MNKICRPKSSYCEELKLIIKKSKRNKNKFNPTQDFINQAKLEYILRGGKITVLESFKENNACGEALKHGD